MICPACGKEVPDHAVFCGYCGAKLKEEKAEESEPVSVKPEVIDAEASEHTDPEPVEEESAAENPEEKEEGSEDTEAAEAEVSEDIGKTEEADPVSEEPEEPEESSSPETEEGKEEAPDEEKKESEQASEEINEPGKKKPFGKLRKKSEEKKEEPAHAHQAAQEAVKKGKDTVSRIDWSEFAVYGDIIRNPFEEHEIADVPLIAGILVVLLGNWYVFGSFGNGLLVLAFVMAGSMILQYVSAHNRGEYHAGRAFRNAFVMTVTPFTAILIAGIALRTTGGDGSAIVRRLGLIVAMGILAVVLMMVSLMHEGEGISRWLLVLILTAMLACIVYYLSAQYAAQIASLLGAY